MTTSPSICVLDIETNGLDRAVHSILEVGAIAVDSKLQSLSEFSMVRGGPVGGSAEGESKTLYELADDFVRDMHTRNGLWDAVRNSPHSLEDLDMALAGWFQFAGFTRGSVILAGHTIDFDHSFVSEQLPNAARWLHYRKDELGGVARFLTRAGVRVGLTPKDRYPHRGLEDCRIELQDAQALHREVQRLADRDALLRVDELRNLGLPAVKRYRSESDLDFRS